MYVCPSVRLPVCPLPAIFPCCPFFYMWRWNARSKRSVVPASPNFICHFYESKGLSSGLSLCVYVLRLYYVYVLYYIPGSPTCVRFELVKITDVTLCGWLGYKPSVNESIRLDWMRSVSCPNAMHRKFGLLSPGKVSSHSMVLPIFSFLFPVCSVSVIHMDYRIFNIISLTLLFILLY